MKRFFINTNLEVGKTVKLDGVEHNHLKNVLRLKENDAVVLVCGDDYDYLAYINAVTKGDTTLTITDRVLNHANPHADVTVFQALVKSENMALIVQKLTELGVTTLVPFLSEFITSKDKTNKCQKLQEISNQSIKQCKRSKPINVTSVKTFNEVVESLKDYDVVIFANETEKSVNLSEIKLDKSQKVALIVGSEGGFSQSEIDALVKNNAKSITMGNRILRAETAVISLTACVMFLMGEWDHD